MADRDDEPEGWQVPQRPAVIAALAVPAGLLALLLVAGHFYARDVQPLHRQPIETFPAPGIETYIHDGALDPHRPRPARPRDPAIAAAKRAVAAQGLAGWEARR